VILMYDKTSTCCDIDTGTQKDFCKEEQCEAHTTNKSSSGTTC